MLHKKKHQKKFSQSSEFMKEIEENTNFLIGKRNQRMKTNSNKAKLLYHIVENDGKLKGGII